MIEEILFTYGSHVYGTVTMFSDKDYILVSDCSDVHENIDPNFQVIHWPDFIEDVAKCKVYALECMSILLNDKYSHLYKLAENENGDFVKERLKTYHILFFNKKQLRKEFSQVASNSFVKAKKKCILEGEDPYIGVKSLFHSIRILDFGIQIATNPQHIITDFNSCNDIWAELFTNRLNFFTFRNKEAKYKEFIDKWKKLYNEKHSQFKLVTEK